jgi:hypothetical protein
MILDFPVNTNSPSWLVLWTSVNIHFHIFQHSEIHHQAVLSSSGKKSKPAACLVSSQVTTWHWGLGPGTSMHSRDYCGVGCMGWDGAFKAGTLIGNWFEDGQRRGHHSGGSHLAITQTHCRSGPFVIPLVRGERCHSVDVSVEDGWCWADERNMHD